MGEPRTNRHASSDTAEESAFATVGPDACSYEQYATEDLEEDFVLLQDRDNEAAWIVSDEVVTLPQRA